MTDDVHKQYENPLVQRYASKEMSYIWSPENKFCTWRRLWISLAKAEKDLGLPITEAQIAELESHARDINYSVAEAKEKEFRHDVMAHVHAYGDQCPEAKGIIHLGATSCFVTDNSELIQIRSSFQLLRRKLLQVVNGLKSFALAHKDLPTLGFTHYQPAQLVTVGKRATLWMFDLLQDYERLVSELEGMHFRGVKGTTGTQASFLELFDGDHAKVRALDRRVTEMMGFSRSVPVCGQTYSRKLDTFVLTVLSGIASSVHKMATDIRLLMNLKEVEEPFGKSQIGSSAMAYKRNPMRSERMCALSRYVMSLPANAYQTHSVQWFERTLDDSANRRLILGEGFLAVDVLLTTALDVVSGLHVWPKVIASHVQSELPFMATENILMDCVKRGGDRQVLHEAIRELSMEAARHVKEEGRPNDLLELIEGDARFSAVHGELSNILDPKKFIGRCPEQVDEFLSEEVDPVLARDGALLSESNADVVSV